MKLTYLIDEKYIPDDGSKEVIDKFSQNTDADILIFPDVHMKKGSKIANGMLISSCHDIYLSCLGVENCGYTFGRVLNNNAQELIDSFLKFSDVLKERTSLKKYSKEQISLLFEKYLRADYEKKKFLYEFLGVSDINELLLKAHKILDDKILNLASKTLCTLGGGNHFFELHEIEETYSDGILKEGDHIFMLHSDSISVGDIIYELFSDLHEMYGNGSFRNRLRIQKFKLYQRRYFNKLTRNNPAIRSDLNLIFNPKDDYQTIDVRTSLGSTLLLAHNISSIFGEMNRDAIINEWSRITGIKIEKLGSHSHDNVVAEMHKNEIRIVHRNGVQKISDDEYCMLPSAMGNYSYVMKNTFNEEAYFSTNHGTGRMQDKHIAREEYSEKITEQEMKDKKVHLFRVGKGNLAEQNMHAFKDPAVIVNEMEKRNLAVKYAKTRPIAVIKG